MYGSVELNNPATYLWFQVMSLLLPLSVCAVFPAVIRASFLVCLSRKSSAQMISPATPHPHVEQRDI